MIEEVGEEREKDWPTKGWVGSTLLKFGCPPGIVDSLHSCKLAWTQITGARGLVLPEFGVGDADANCPRYLRRPT